MKNKIKLLFALVLACVSFSSIYGENAAETVYWIRPVKTNDTVNYNGTILYFVKDACVQVEAEKSGNIIVGDTILQTDSRGLTDYKRKISMTKAQLQEKLNLVDSLKQHLKIINDSVMVFEVKDLFGADTVRVFINGFEPVRSLTSANNDTVALKELGIKGKDDYIIFVSDNLLATYVQITDIKAEQTVDAATTEVDGSNPWETTWFQALVCLLVLVIVGLVVFIFVKRKQNSNGKDVAGDETVRNATKRLMSLVNKTKKVIKNSNLKNQSKKDLAIKLDNSVQSVQTMCNALEEKENLSEDIYIGCTSSINHLIDKVTEVKNIEYPAQVPALMQALVSCDNEIKEMISEIKEYKGNVSGASAEGREPESEGSGEDEEDKTSGNVISFTRSEAADSELTEEERLREECKSLKKLNDQLDKDLKKEKRSNSELNETLSKTKEKLEEVKSNQETTIKNKLEKIKKEFDNKLSAEQAECKKKIESANKRADKAEEKAKTISDDLNAKFDIERRKTKEERDALNRSLSEKQNQLSSVSATLAKTTDDLKLSQRRVENLTAETTSFRQHLSGVKDSQPYCESVLRLIDLAKRIQESASALMEADLEDKYFVYKPLALYFGKLNLINLVNFYSDVEMISKTGFVLKGTPLASYDQTLPKSELESMTKNYFFTTYLKAYIDAIVVLNESLAGLHYLVEDVKPSDVKKFAGYRGEIEEISRRLGINILTVKVFDAVGTNIDLQATEIDAGVEKHGAILEIENCKVSLIGGAPNKERIVVKIQK